MGLLHGHCMCGCYGWELDLAPQLLLLLLEHPQDVLPHSHYLESASSLAPDLLSPKLASIEYSATCYNPRSGPSSLRASFRGRSGLTRPF